MSFWRNSMPPGMELKSEGPACDLFDWRNEFPIEDGRYPQIFLKNSQPPLLEKCKWIRLLPT